MIEETPVQRLIHDVNSLAKTLIDAAEALRSLTPAEQKELVREMVEPSQRLADTIRRYSEGAARR